MAIARITSQDTTGTSAAATVTVNYPAKPLNRSLLIAVVGTNAGSGTGTTITDWTVAVDSSGGLAPDCAILYKIATAGESTAVTANGNGATLMDIAIFEYTGFTAGKIDRTSSSNIGSTLAASTGTTATTQSAKQLLIAAVMWPSVVQTLSSWSNTFTSRATVASHLFVSDQIVSATGAYTTTCTVTGTSSAMASAIASFMFDPLAINDFAFVTVGDGMSTGEKIR